MARVLKVAPTAKAFATEFLQLMDIKAQVEPSFCNSTCSVWDAFTKTIEAGLDKSFELAWAAVRHDKLFMALIDSSMKLCVSPVYAGGPAFV